MKSVHPAFDDVGSGSAFVFKMTECLIVAAVVDLDQHSEKYSSRGAAFDFANATRRRGYGLKAAGLDPFLSRVRHHQPPHRSSWLGGVMPPSLAQLLSLIKDVIRRKITPSRGRADTPVWRSPRGGFGDRSGRASTSDRHDYRLLNCGGCHARSTSSSSSSGVSLSGSKISSVSRKPFCCPIVCSDTVPLAPSNQRSAGA